MSTNEFSLLKRAVEVEKEIDRVREQISQMETKLHRLYGQRELLRELRHEVDRSAKEIEDESRPSYVGVEVRREGGEPPSPAEAVDDLVMNHPGIPRHVLIDSLKDKVKTSSDNPEKVISATVSRRLSQGRFVETKDGRLYASTHPRVREDSREHDTRRIQELTNQRLQELKKRVAAAAESKKEEDKET